MEVRHQHIDRLEAVARGNEDVGFTLERLHDAVFVGRGLKQAQRRRPDRDNAAAGAAGLVDRCRRIG